VAKLLVTNARVDTSIRVREGRALFAKPGGRWMQTESSAWSVRMDMPTLLLVGSAVHVRRGWSQLGTTASVRSAL
jgi:hypothetical protein